MLIVEEDFAVAATAIASATPFNASMPGSRLRELQVSRRSRVTTISDTPRYDLSLAGTPAGSIIADYDVVAVVGYDGAPHRNMFRYATRWGLDASWVRSGFLVGSNFVAPPATVSFRPWLATAVAGGNHVEQTMTSKPGKGGSGSAALSLAVGIPIRQVSTGGDGDLRIQASDNASGANFVAADFDLSAGAVTATSDGGTYTIDGTEIEDLGAGWYLCWALFTCSTEDQIKWRFAAVTPGGSTTMVGDEIYDVGPPVCMLQSATRLSSEYPITSGEGTGPMFQVRLDYSSITGSSTDSGWMHAVARNKLRGFSRYAFVHTYTTNRAEDQIRVELWDPDNALTWIEAGRLIVGRSVDLGSVHAARYALGAEETGGEQEADGGQIYRPQRTVRRRQQIRLQHMTEAQAFDSIHRIQRVQGRSRQILVIGDEDSAKYLQEYMIYGFIDSIEPMPSEVQDSSGNPLWEWSFTIRETP